MHSSTLIIIIQSYYQPLIKHHPRCKLFPLLLYCEQPHYYRCEGHTCEEAEDGHKAVEKVKEKLFAWEKDGEKAPYDVVLMDFGNNNNAYDINPF